MPKEWILNQANMRWGLTKKNKVGAVSDEIRKSAPKSVSEWKEYYYSNVYPKEHLENLGRTLYMLFETPEDTYRAYQKFLKKEEYKKVRGMDRVTVGKGWGDGDYWR